MRPRSRARISRHFFCTRFSGSEDGARAPDPLPWPLSGGAGAASIDAGRGGGTLFARILTLSAAIVAPGDGRHTFHPFHPLQEGHMRKRRLRPNPLLVESLEIRRLLATFTATLEPLNNSGVSGTAEMTLEDNLLTVTVNARGLEANQIHPQHIQGRFDESTPGTPGGASDSVRPTTADDADADGFIESGEAVVSAGSIILPLSSPPGNDTAADPASTLTFPTANADGTITFTQQYDLSNAAQFFDPGGTATDRTGADVLPLDLRTIVIQGLTVAEGVGTGSTGEVNGTAGYKQTLPVAAGEIVETQGGGGSELGSGVFRPDGDATGELELPANFTSREASFDNELGFFLTDADGSIDGIAPGEAGWAEAALRSPTRQVLFGSGSDAGEQAMPSFT